MSTCQASVLDVNLRLGVAVLSLSWPSIFVGGDTVFALSMALGMGF